MDDEELKEQQEEMEILQTESGIESGQKKRSYLYVFLCWLAGIQSLTLVAFFVREVGGFGIALLALFLLCITLPVVPLTLMGIACGLPRYKDKSKIKTMLLLNVALWLAVLFFAFLYTLTLHV